MTAEDLAKLFHETYERLAPLHGYTTRKASAVPWDEVPENNRRLMVATCGEVLQQVVGQSVPAPTAKTDSPAHAQEIPVPIRLTEPQIIACARAAHEVMCARHELEGDQSWFAVSPVTRRALIAAVRSYFENGGGRPVPGDQIVPEGLSILALDVIDALTRSFQRAQALVGAIEHAGGIDAYCREFRVGRDMVAMAILGERFVGANWVDLFRQSIYTHVLAIAGEARQPRSEK